MKPINKEEVEILPNHGTLIEHHNIGVFLIGESGSGKSECALSLLLKGAKLICDDAPLFRMENNKVIGYCSKAFYHKLHIRDLGIINTLDYYPDSTLVQTQLKLIISLSLNKAVSEVLEPEFSLLKYKQAAIYKITLSDSKNRNMMLKIEKLDN